MRFLYQLGIVSFLLGVLLVVIPPHGISTERKALTALAAVGLVAECMWILFTLVAPRLRRQRQKGRTAVGSSPARSSPAGTESLPK
jgi:drug/metabolite transporter (DMT)-like permease